MLKAFATMLPYMRRYRARFLWGMLFVILANAISVSIPYVVGESLNAITDRGNLLDDLAWAGVFIVSLAGLAGCFRYLMRRVLIDTSRDIEFDFRNDVYDHLQEMDATFYDNNSTGDIMSRMTNDIDTVRLMLGPAIMYTANSVFTLPLVIGLMVFLEWQVAVTAMLPLALLPVLVKYFGSRLHKRSRLQQDQMGELTTYVQESLAGIRIIKAYGQEEDYARGFDRENDEYIDKSLNVAKLQAVFFPSIRLLAGTGMIIILLVGARQILAGSMEIGTLVTLIMLYGMLIWPLVAAGWVINIFQRAAAALERLDEVLSVHSHVSDRETAVAPEAIPELLDVEFRDLTFTYDGADRPALKGINLKVPAGETLGIVGRVGAGKSTLIQLLLRLYPVEDGKIFIGGIDINDWPLEHLRRVVGMVFQETFLFSDTIAENVQFGAQRDLGDEEIIAAARKADVHKDIVEFPLKYDTLLGERGINLSGGQKQRLSISRALVRDARILILDDCLSAVDTHTEEAILGSLRQEMQGRSTFLVSHRISTVAMADEVIVLEDGEITQRGTHAQLVEQPGLYGELYRKQLLEEEVEGIA